MCYLHGFDASKTRRTALEIWEDKGHKPVRHLSVQEVQASDGAGRNTPIRALHFGVTIIIIIISRLSLVRLLQISVRDWSLRLYVQSATLPPVFPPVLAKFYEYIKYPLIHFFM
jgi:hypothetical protein